MPRPFERLVVLDFEATCDHGEQPDPQEIIEYPSVLLSAETFEIVDEFRSFVRPQHHPVLTQFCREFTSITQAQADAARPFAAVFHEHIAWLRGHDLRVESGDEGHDFTFLLCGDWDLKKMLPAQCRVCDPPIDHVPVAFRRWVNIKKHFARHFGMRKAPGMAGMMRKLEIELTGHHHCGIDDCRNIAKIARWLAECGVVLSTTTELPPA